MKDATKRCTSQHHQATHANERQRQISGLGREPRQYHHQQAIQDQGIRWFEASPTYVLHWLNAWEEGDEIVMHGYHQKSPMPEKGYDNSGNTLGPGRYGPTIYEWRLNLRTGQTHERVMQAVIQADGHTPIHVDLRRLEITIAGAGVVAFHIDAQQQRMLLEGLDEISMTLKHIDAIERWERATQRVT